MQEIAVGKNEAGQRLDKLLGKYLNLAGKGFLYKMMRKKNITLNGKKCIGSELLEEGDRICLFLSDETIEKFSETRVRRSHGVSLDILYEDEDILLINKPAGMLSQSAAREDTSLVEHLLGYLIDTGAVTREQLKSFHPSVCNRLDRNTSGIVAAGKSMAGLQMLSEVFRDRSVHKYYQCIVSGTIKETRAIEGWLKKDEAANRVSVTKKKEEGAVPIRTKYEPISVSGSYTLLWVTLETGRSHQIRAHLSSIGHPIVGDRKYGGGSGAGRQLLHSCRLEFPELKGRFSYLSGRVFDAPLPEDFAAFGKRVGLIS